MKLIVWLWNPGKQYEITRHNLGYLFLDFIKFYNTSHLTPLLWRRGEYDWSEFKYEPKFKWDISTWQIWWEKVILLKPTTFMNLSWESIKKIVDFFKINKEDIIIIYDDISMDFWKIRFRDSWSAGWHNWIKSIINNIWDDFNRIKVWIWINNKYEVSDWVLSKFKKEELKTLNEDIFPKAYELLEEKSY